MDTGSSDDSNRVSDTDFDDQEMRQSKVFSAGRKASRSQQQDLDSADDFGNAERTEQEYSDNSDDDGGHDSDDDNNHIANPDDSTDPLQVISKASANPKPLTALALKKFQDKMDKTGVVYMSRVPPFMKPAKVRSLLSQYGKIGRIFLNPEDAKVAARRRKYKHNKRINYIEGWIEFLDKKAARQVATTLNNTIIGGKKRSHYHDDIWNIKYLPRFKWSHLTEQLAYELKVKEQRLRTEMQQAKRENSIYLQNVGKAKKAEAIAERQKQKQKQTQTQTQIQTQNQKRDRQDDDNGIQSAPATSGAASADTAAIRQRFKQRRVIQAEQDKKPSSKTSSLLSKIFTS
eukprot:jgi/Hompol1/575/HPOL_002558-RA